MPFVGQCGKQMYVSGMALYKHFCDAGNTTKVAVDLEGRVCIKEVGVCAACFPERCYGGLYLFAYELHGMVAIEQACP